MDAPPELDAKPVILTGDRPTGPLHLGHYVGSLRNRVKLQDQYQQFLLIADAQALTDYFERPTLVHDNVLEVALDYLAVGLEPSKNVFVVQSEVSELFELTAYFMNLVSVARLERNPTIKDEIQSREFERSVPAGFLTYPVSQAADILAFRADLVPVGADQAPMIEQTNEIARKFNQTYCGSRGHRDVFKEVKGLVGEVGRLPGIDGRMKMSKSAGNAISLSDSADVIKKKVQMMFTDPNHLRVSDPGQVEGNVVFMFLDFFDPDRDSLEEMKNHYRRGGLGDSKVKARLVDVLENLLSPIRQRRAEFAEDQSAVMNLLKEGTRNARQMVAATLHDAKAAMGIRYF